MLENLRAQLCLKTKRASAVKMRSRTSELTQAAKLIGDRHFGVSKCKLLQLQDKE